MDVGNPEMKMGTVNQGSVHQFGCTIGILQIKYTFQHLSKYKVAQQLAVIELIGGELLATLVHVNHLVRTCLAMMSRI